VAVIVVVLVGELLPILLSVLAVLLPVLSGLIPLILTLAQVLIPLILTRPCRSRAASGCRNPLVSRPGAGRCWTPAPPMPPG
jgi:hypothetical protein